MRFYSGATSSLWPDAMEAASASLPVELTQIRPNRWLAVHARRNPRASVRLFIVHGSCSSMVPFEDCIKHFSPLHEVIAYDFCGCGRSKKPRDWYAYSYSALKDDLSAVITKYSSADKDDDKIPPMKNVIVAHSAGCSLSLAVTASEPSLPIHGLCLLGAFADRVPAHPVFYLPAFVLDWMQPTLSAGFEAVALHEETRKGETEAQRRVLAVCQELNASNAMYMCKAYYRQFGVPSHEDVQRVRVPVMLMAGEDDKLIPLAATSKLNALLPHAELRTVARSSHQMMQENPTAVCDNITDFIGRI